MLSSYSIMNDNNEIRKQLMKELKPILLKIRKRENNRNYRNKNPEAYKEMKKNYMKKLINLVKKYFANKKKRKEFEKKLEELRKRDPFIYNH